MKQRKYIIYSACSVILLVIMFILSQQPGEISYGLSDYLGDMIKRIALAFSIDLSRLSIRKIAHIILYFLLGVTSALMFQDLFKWRKLKCIYLISFVCSFVFCTIAAAFDEWHQTFIPERTGQPKDVFLDIAGFGIAIFIIEILIYLSRRNKAKVAI